MLPRVISCEDCGQSALVRGYGRVEYSWRTPDEAEFKTIRLTIDCPRCGVKLQEYHPAREFQLVHEGQL
jgi:DNA-directed RNA polymerase subunit RPC12/RpoP